MTVDEGVEREKDEKENQKIEIKTVIDILDSQGWIMMEEPPEWCNTPPGTKDDTEKLRGENPGGGGRIKNPIWEVSLTIMMAS